MEAQIRLARVGVGPAGIAAEHLLTQFLGNAKTLERPETADSRAPVMLLVPPGSIPVAGRLRR